MPSIFELDGTISITPTIAEYCIDKAKPTEDQYELGKKIGRINRKKSVEHFFIHNDYELCGIATLHNNPAFVAGYIAALLNKELTFIQTIYSKTTPDIAVNEYIVKGLDKPIFICFVPHIGKEYHAALNALRVDKNVQIDFLRKIWIENRLIQRTSVIDLYDNSFKVCEAAQKLLYVNIHKVSGFVSDFIIYNYVYYKIKSAHTNIEEFDNYLTKLFKKAQILESDGSIQASLAADTLYNTLSDQFDNLYYGTLPLEDFQQNCYEAIDTAHEELDIHRGWKELLGNIALFISTLGIGFLAKGIYNVCTNKPFLFFAKTDSAQTLDEGQECLDSMVPCI
jgi:hypothetical protein